MGITEDFWRNNAKTLFKYTWSGFLVFLTMILFKLSQNKFGTGEITFYIKLVFSFIFTFFILSFQRDKSQILNEGGKLYGDIGYYLSITILWITLSMLFLAFIFGFFNTQAYTLIFKDPGTKSFWGYLVIGVALCMFLIVALAILTSVFSIIKEKYLFFKSKLKNMFSIYGFTQPVNNRIEFFAFEIKVLALFLFFFEINLFSYFFIINTVSDLPL